MQGNMGYELYNNNFHDRNTTAKTADTTEEEDAPDPKFC